MSYILGIDGGGTKTAFLAYRTEDGGVTTTRRGSISPQDHGIEAFREALLDGACELTGGRLEELRAVCVGVPCRGEDPAWDKLVDQSAKGLFPGAKSVFVNDCAVGWAGALALEPGINIVSGTGAIAYGESAGGRSARSNGWSGEFSDEGSCCWLGKKCLELFSKQADGRVPKGALYGIVRESLGLELDMDIIKIYEARFQGDRRETAGLQRLLFQAAQAGDASAQEAYSQAAVELAASIEAVRRGLDMTGKVPVSYSGGLFKTGGLILAPLRRELAGLYGGYDLRPPLYTPEAGAVLMAARAAGHDIKDIVQNIDRTEDLT